MDRKSLFTSMVVEKGAPKTRNRPFPGRNTTKIHAIVDALGNPILIYLTGGQVSDLTPAIDLMNLFDLENSYVLADKGYDSKEFVPIEAKGGIPVIPSRKNAKQPRSYDQYVYQDRRLIENCFLLLKNNRRIATRYEKTLISYLGMIDPVCILIWLR